jgi:ATP-dependent protease HslVU (ClpYQ) peptidase subunit
MTTLAAVQGKGWAVIGCDSRSSDESGRPMDMATHKIIENNGVLIAGSGAGRGSNLLQFGWKAPKPTAAEDLDKFMTQKFIPAMRKLFVDSGYDMKEDGDAASHDSSFLIVVRGVIYPVFEDYSWDRDTRGVYYSGSGGDIALGALEALCVDDPELTADYAETLVKHAIEIASKWDIYTAGPVIIKTQRAR